MLACVYGTAEVIAEKVTYDECRCHARQDSCSSSHDWIPLGRKLMNSHREYAECRRTLLFTCAERTPFKQRREEGYLKHAIEASGATACRWAAGEYLGRG